MNPVQTPRSSKTVAKPTGRNEPIRRELPAPPSLSLWVVISLSVSLLLAIAALVCSPTAAPTAAPVFWFGTLGMPLLMGASLSAIRYGIHAMRKQDASSWNNDCDAYNALLHEIASRPLSVLGSAYKFSDDDEENASLNVGSGDLRLLSRRLPDRGGVVRARWLSAPEGAVARHYVYRDRDRQEVVLVKLIESLLLSLKPSIQSLPPQVPIKMYLQIACPDLEDSADEIFRSLWAQQNHPNQIKDESGQDRLESMVTWLDQDPNEPARAILLVAIELSTLYSKAPPNESAEVGTLFLLAPEKLVKVYALDPKVCVHRPAHGLLPKFANTFNVALSYTDLDFKSIDRLWYSGFDKYLRPDMLCSAAASGFDLGSPGRSNEHDLDWTVGRSAVAGDWLALACACEFAKTIGSPQLVARSDGKYSTVCVVKPVEITNTYTSL